MWKCPGEIWSWAWSSQNEQNWLMGSNANTFRILNIFQNPWHSSFLFLFHEVFSWADLLPSRRSCCSRELRRWRRVEIQAGLDCLDVFSSWWQAPPEAPWGVTDGTVTVISHHLSDFDLSILPIVPILCIFSNLKETSIVPSVHLPTCPSTSLPIYLSIYVSCIHPLNLIWLKPI